MLRMLAWGYVAMVLMAAAVAFSGQVLMGLGVLLAATGGAHMLAHDIIHPPLGVRVPSNVDELL